MSIFDGLLSRWGYVKAKAQEKVTGWPLADAGVERWSIPQDGSVYGNQASLYQKLSWVSTAIEITAQTAAAQPFEVHTVKGEEESEIENHPLETLFYNPNPLQSRFEFLVSTFSYYKLTGNAYWWLNASSANAEPAEIWVIPTPQIVPIPDEKLFIKCYRYDPGSGATIDLEPWEVVHFRRFNPFSMFVGMSPIEAVSTQAQSDMARVEYDYRMYKDENGRIPSILAFADAINNSDWERLQREARDKEKKRQMMMLRGVGTGGIQWLQATLSNSDMQYLEQRTFTKEEIWALFAPGLSSMLAVNATEANSKAGKATFTEMTIFPMLDNIAQKVTKDLLPLYGENLRGEFEDPRTKDRVLEMQEQVEYSKTHTIEEIRAKYYNDKPLGDDRDKLLPVQVNAATGDGQEKPIPPQLQPFTGQPAPQSPQNGTQQKELPKPAQNTEEAAPQGNVQEPTDETSPAELKTALVAYQKFALHQQERGKALDQPFINPAITDRMGASIRVGLKACKSREEIISLFSALMPVDPYEELKRNNDLLAKYGAVLVNG